MWRIKSIVSTLLLVFIFFVLESESVSVWEDITLTMQEKRALDKFRIVMNNSLIHDYMRKDIYLIKWLRAKNLDIPGAQKFLQKHLHWREEFGMDTIIDDDFGSLVYEYPYSTDAFDYEGRPVLSINAADWDIRRGVLSGQKEKIIRWAFRAYEIGVRTVRELQDKGKNVTQFVMICNFDGFNFIQHGCLQCIDVFVNFLSVYEQNFPGMADSIIGIKTPQTFQVVLQALTAVMSKETKEAVKIWGPNKNEWQTNLLKLVPADQLDEEFGGTRNSI